MVVFFRHGVKLHSNGKSVQGIASSPWDPPIIRPEVVEESAEKLPFIKRMFVSPFLRCRQTAYIIRNVLQEKQGNVIEFIIDPRIREFLGVWKSHGLYVEKETQKLVGNRQLVETTDAYINRVVDFYTSMKLTDTDCVVTHNMYVELISERYYGRKLQLHQGKFVELTKPYYVMFKGHSIHKALLEDFQQRVIFYSDDDFTYASHEMDHSHYLDEEFNTYHCLKEFNKFQNVVIYRVPTHDKVLELVGKIEKFYGFTFDELSENSGQLHIYELSSVSNLILDD